VKDVSGKVLSEGKIPATRQGLQEWFNCHTDLIKIS
jgi:hypothetical protein